MVKNDNKNFCFLFHSILHILLAMVIKNKELRKLIAKINLTGVKEAHNFDDCHFVIIKNFSCRENCLVLMREEYKEWLVDNAPDQYTIFFLHWLNPRNVKDLNKRLLSGTMTTGLKHNYTKNYFKRNLKKNI